MCIASTFLFLRKRSQLNHQVSANRLGEVGQELREEVDTSRQLLQELIMVLKARNLKLYEILDQLIDIIICSNQIIFNTLSLFHADDLFNLVFQFTLIDGILQIALDVFIIDPLLLLRLVL